MRPVVYVLFHTQFGVEALEYLACNFHSGQYAWFFDDKLLRAGFVSRDCAQGGGIAVTDILGKGEGQQVVYKLVFGLHYLYLRYNCCKHVPDDTCCFRSTRSISAKYCLMVLLFSR